MNCLNKTQLLSLLLVFGISLANAQQDSLGIKRKSVPGFFESGEFIQGDFSKLNSVLVQNGFPALENFYGGISIGATRRPVDKDSYVSARLFFYFAQPDFNTGLPKNSEMIYWGVHEAWHLDFVKNRMWRIGPDVGFGAGFVTLRLTERVATFNSFNASVANFNTHTQLEKKFSSSFIFLSTGVSAERKFKISVFDFYFGIGAGYRFSTNTKFFEGSQLYTDSPKVGLKGVEYNFKIRFEVRELPKTMSPSFKHFY